MGAKLKSKTHLLNRFFDFLSRFFAHLASTIEKKNFFEKSIKVSKNAEFHADFESVEKVGKKCTKKKLKSAFFRHIFC